MSRHAALVFLAIASPLVLLSFVWNHPAAPVMFAFLVVTFPVALIVLGAVRGGRLGPLRWPLAGLLLIFLACTAGMLLLRGQVLQGPWLGGLPLAAVLQLFGMMSLPLVLVALAYALTFETYGLRDADLERLRRLGLRKRDAERR